MHSEPPSQLPIPVRDEAIGHVFDLLSEGVVCLYHDGRMGLNRAARRLLGADDEATARRVLTGQADAVLVGEDGAPVEDSLIGLASRLPVSPPAPAIVGLLGSAGARWLRLCRHQVQAQIDTVLMTDVTAEMTVRSQQATARANMEARERLVGWGADFSLSFESVRELFLGECMQLLRGTGAAFARIEEADAVVEEAIGDWEAARGARILTGELGDAEGVWGELLAQRIIRVGPDQAIAGAGFPLSHGVKGLVCVTAATGGGVDARAQLERLVADVGPIMAHRHTLHVLETGIRRDPLTGLPNLAEFYAHAEQAADSARRRGKPLAVVLFNIDDLEQINRDHGHAVGDQVIAAVADRLRRVVMGRRGRNLMARLGEDTLAWLMVDTDGILAETTAELGRSQVLAAPLPLVGLVSVSAGICDYGEGRDTAQVLRLARGALYWAKSHGRNQVCRYRPEVVSDLSATDTVNRLRREVSGNSLKALARAVDLKDPRTREHSVRVARLAAQLADELGWSPPRRELLYDTCLVHDVGKIGVADAILFKPERLTTAERELIEQHTVMGARICGEFLEPEQTAWIRSHHERWDGAGYPDRIAGERIPAGARIIFVADSVEAMTARRSYQEQRWLHEALQECRAEAGRQFDPAVVDALLRLAEREELGWVEQERDLT